MQVSCEIFNLQQLNALREQLSEDAIKQCEQNGGFAVLARNEEHTGVLGIAVCVVDDSVRNGLKLSYLLVEPTLRRQGIATALLEKTFAFARELSLEVMQCDFARELADAAVLSLFLKAAGFAPVILNWHILTYRPETLLRSDALGRIDSAAIDRMLTRLSKGEVSYLCRYDESLPPYIRSLLKHSANVENSIFYCTGRSIQGCALVGPVQENGLSLLDIYLNSHVKQQVILLYMLAYLFGKEEDLMQRVRTVYLHVIDENCYRLYRKVFGAPERDYCVQRYERELVLPAE